ncbi:MAG: hypothetical protein ABEK01_05770 [Candidatus Nanohaloarchaea archaeon]
MEIRERIVRGYINAYLRSEQKMVTKLLVRGRITGDEWEEYSRELNKVAGRYETGEIGPEEYLDRRKDIKKQIKSPGEKGEGITPKEAMEKYREQREKEENLLIDAMKRSDRSSLSLLLKIPSIKASHLFSSLRYS